MSGNVIGGVIGAAVGFFIPGVGPAMGWMIGSVAGGLLMPPELEGPRLSDLRPQGSEYGRPIPIIKGTAVVSGNVIWQTDLIEEGSGGGKGGPSVTTYSYFANFAVLLCEGEVTLGRIWAGPEKRLIWDGSTLEGGSITFYSGSATQMPDPLMESHLGVGNVPAYRGYSYIVFENFPLANDGNRVPFLTVEVGNVLSSSQDVGTVWPVGEIFLDDAGGTYSITYSGSFDGVVTRRLADDSFVSNYQWGFTVPGTVNSWFDADRNRIFYLDVDAFWVDLDTGLTGTWSNYGAPANYTAVGGVYHNGLYYVLMHNSVAGVGVGISVIDPDTLAVIDFLEGDAGAAASGLVNFCAHRQEGDTYLIGATKAGTVRKYPLVDGFTSVSCGASVANAVAAIDPNTGYVWSATFDGPTATLTVACNDPVTEAQLYTEVILTEADGWVVSAPRRAVPFVFGSGKVLVLMDKWLAIDYFAEFTASPPALLALLQGRYHGSSGLQAGFWNAARGQWWFLRAYGWLNLAIGGDLTYVALTGGDNSLYPGSGIRIGDTGLTAEGELLSDIVLDLCQRAGLAADEVDVTALQTDMVDGYSIAQQTTVRGAIQVLQPAFYFDVVESDGVAKFVKRGGASVVTIPDADLGAHRPGSDPDKDLILIKRQMEDELPSALTVKYLNRNADYEVYTKQARRLVGGSGDEQTFELPIVMADEKAMGVAETNLHKAWVGRKTFAFNLPLKYTYLEPTDIITIKGQTMMLTRVAQDDVILKCEGVFDDFSYTPHVVVTESDPSSAGGSAVFVPSPTQPALMNLVALRDADHDAGFYAAACGTDAANWRGATLYESRDGGANYTSVGVFSRPSTMGTTTSVLGAFAGGDAVDEANSVNVRLTYGELSSTTADGLAAGINVCAIGSEIVFFRDAALEVDGSYTLTGLLRGRRGSTYAIGSHLAGESFVMLSTSTTIRIWAAPSDIGKTYKYKAVSVGASLADTLEFTFTNEGTAYQALTSVDVAAPATLYGRDPLTTTGLTWGYYGGAKRKSDGTIVIITAGTVALTDNATNYIYATDAGVVTVTTIAPAGWPAPLAANATALYEVVTANGVVVSYVDYRTAGGGGSSAGGLPTGGLAGQQLRKNSGTDYDASWVWEPFDIHTFYPGTTAVSAKLYRGKLARAVTFAANFAGSQFTASANATAATVFDIQKNGVSVGSCTVAAGGVVPTFASSGGAAVVFAAGDILSIVAPAAPDVTLADPAITLSGTR